MEHELRSLLITTAEAYASAAQCAVSTVSRRCRGEPGFFKRIAEPGNSFTMRSFDETMVWFAANWPDGVDLPAHLRRYVRPMVASVPPQTAEVSP